MVYISTLKWLKKVGMHMLGSRVYLVWTSVQWRQWSNWVDAQFNLGLLVSWAAPWAFLSADTYGDLCSPCYDVYIRNMTWALLLCSHSHNDVPLESRRNVSMAAVRGAVHPSIWPGHLQFANKIACERRHVLYWPITAMGQMELMFF